MKSHSLDAAIRQQFDICKRQGKALLRSTGAGEVHSFRVETKRLRALLRLAASPPHPSVKDRLPRNLRVCYAMTGLLRNLQVQQRALEEAAVRVHQDMPVDFSALLDDRIRTATIMLKLYLKSASPFSHGQVEWRHPIPALQAHAAIDAFVARKVRALTLPSPGRIPDDEQLHVIRKAIKDLMFAWPLLSDRLPLHAQTTGIPTRKDAEASAHMLGEYHDVCLQLSLLQDTGFLLCSEGSAAEFAKAVEKLWLTDKSALRDRILRMLLPDNPIGALNLPEESFELHVD